MTKVYTEDLYLWQLLFARSGLPHYRSPTCSALCSSRMSVDSSLNFQYPRRVFQIPNMIMNAYCRYCFFKVFFFLFPLIFFIGCNAQRMNNVATPCRLLPHHHLAWVCHMHNIMVHSRIPSPPPPPPIGGYVMAALLPHKRSG